MTARMDASPDQAAKKSWGTVDPRRAKSDLQTDSRRRSQSRTYMSAEVMPDVTEGAEDGKFCDSSRSSSGVQWIL
jgi:hypothetical protein